MELRDIIEKAWDDRSLLNDKEVILALKTIIEDLDHGDRRVAEPTEDGWKVNEWIKKAVILYFPIQKMQTVEVGHTFEFHDKMKLKTGYAQKGARVVPHHVKIWRLCLKRSNNDAILCKYWCLCRCRNYG